MLITTFFVSVYACTLSAAVIKISASIHPTTHPSITPPVAMSSTTHNITPSPSLVDDPRHNLEKWTESVETVARSMCAMHDVTDALTLVMSDEKCTRMPVNVTNPIDVAAGQPAVYRNRPAYAMPAGNAPSAAVNIHRMAATRHNDFSFASSSLKTVLLASLGEANEDTLRTTFPDLAPYMLDPRQPDR
jgi:hypothetical protein